MSAWAHGIVLVCPWLRVPGCGCLAVGAWLWVPGYACLVVYLCVSGIVLVTFAQRHLVHKGLGLERLVEPKLLAIFLVCILHVLVVQKVRLTPQHISVDTVVWL